MAEATKMNPAVKQLWVTALRSGEYKQGRHGLKRGKRGNNTYCCLGVLCDIYHKETGKGAWVEDDLGNTTSSYSSFAGDSTYLPECVSNWSNLLASDPCFKYNKHLSTANDDGVSFSEIATLIEDNL